MEISEADKRIIETPSAKNVAQKREAIKQAKAISRRDFFKRVVLPAAGVAAVTAAGGWGLVKATDQLSQNTAEPEAEPAKPPEGILNLERVNKILSLDPDSPERKGLEQEYTAEVIASGKLIHLDRAFKFVSNSHNRMDLLDTRWKYRESGQYADKDQFKLRELTGQEKKFAEDPSLHPEGKLKLHPELVAVCIDARIQAANMLLNKVNEMGKDAFLQQFKQDIDKKLFDELRKLNPEQLIEMLLPPVGVIIGIAINETSSSRNGVNYALTGIGSEAALNLLRGDTPENTNLVKQGLKNLAGVLSVDGVQFHADKIPGASQKKEDPLSGGDLGSVQYRPDTAWEEYNYLENHFGFKLNPLGLEAVTAIYLLLFKGQKWQEKNQKTGVTEDKYRIGFINGEGYEKTRELALKRVNQSPEYIRKVFEWSAAYKKYVG